jgi:hypothetical protein
MKRVFVTDSRYNQGAVAQLLHDLNALGVHARHERPVLRPRDRSRPPILTEIALGDLRPQP